MSPAAPAAESAPLTGRAVVELLSDHGHHEAAGVVGDMVDQLAAVPLRLAQVAFLYAVPFTGEDPYEVAE